LTGRTGGGCHGDVHGDGWDGMGWDVPPIGEGWGTEMNDTYRGDEGWGCPWRLLLRRLPGSTWARYSSISPTPEKTGMGLAWVMDNGVMGIKKKKRDTSCNTKSGVSVSLSPSSRFSRCGLWRYCIPIPSPSWDFRKRPSIHPWQQGSKEG
jgi:hypothetical protein